MEQISGTIQFVSLAWGKTLILSHKGQMVFITSKEVVNNNNYVKFFILHFQQKWPVKENKNLLAYDLCK